MGRRDKCFKLYTRFLHVSLNFGVMVTLCIYDSALRNALVTLDIGYLVAYYGLLSTSLVLYFVCSLMDPGFVPINNNKNGLCNAPGSPSKSEDRALLDSMAMIDGEGLSEELPKEKVCGFCNSTQPLRARHCDECGRCVRRYDHHCPWLQTCVGERNHRYFWLFLLTTTALIGWTGSITWSAVTVAAHATWWDFLASNAFLLVDAGVLVVAAIVVVALLCFHSYLVVTATTTWESMARHRITYLRRLDLELNPFDEGLCRNAWSFLCHCRERHWEAVYSRLATREV